MKKEYKLRIAAVLISCIVFLIAALPLFSPLFSLHAQSDEIIELQAESAIGRETEGISRLLLCLPLFFVLALKEIKRKTVGPTWAERIFFCSVRRRCYPVGGLAPPFFFS